MPLSKEQAKEIKAQLLKQVEKIPNADQEQIKEYIRKLDEKGLEKFLKQNNIQLSESGKAVQTEQSEKPVFQMIINREIPSFNLEENEKALAILELNPLSKGHSIILPKQKTTIDKIPKSALTLSQKIAKRIKKKLKPDDIKIETFSFQEYPAINIIPIYKDTPLKKQKADENELKKIQKKLEVKKRSPRTKKDKSPVSSQKKENLPEVSFRVP